VASSQNPFRPGAGHPPPYLAGREDEKKEFQNFLEQEVILTNLVMTGLRGVGKTVLLDTLKPQAVSAGWLWASADFSESASVSEESLALRIMADLAPQLAHIVVAEQERASIGFAATPERRTITLSFDVLQAVYDSTPGLVSDKLRCVLEFAWKHVQADGKRGIVLAYDEAQNLGDRARDRQYPLSLLLDVFQSIQRRGACILLVLTGLPTLFPKLVEARTFAERMFHVMTLHRLNEAESCDAILKPLESPRGPVQFPADAVEQIIRYSGGYPYFVQFICREVFDVFLVQMAAGVQAPKVPVKDILKKLDTDFFAGRWARVTDRQRALLEVIAALPHCDEEFTVQEVVGQARQQLARPFSASHCTQLLSKLADNGLVYKNRFGRYSFAVPLLGEFIRRQTAGAGQ
jgi:type II secretory pathway predicted ATPase ExeA